MTQELVILHRAGSERFAFAEQNDANRFGEQAQWFSFKTCMRHILVGDLEGLEEVGSQLNSTDEIYVGADAHRFLLQVICGLHSPLVGETEVYGQFKNAVSAFTWTATPWSMQLQRFFRTLFEDAKRVRQAHLVDLGSQSYGSVLRRELKGLSRLHIVGAGHLVQEILPWISKDGLQIHIHCRNPEKAKAELGKLIDPSFVHAMGDRQGLADADALIIAAPVTADWVKDWFPADGSPQLVSDLRSDSAEDRIEGFARVMGLGEFFERISSNQAHIQARKNAALAAIDAAVSERSRHVEYRPFGWEDVCA